MTALLEGILAIHDKGMPVMKEYPVRHPIKLGRLDGHNRIVWFGKGQALTLVPRNDAERNRRDRQAAVELVLR